MTEELKQKAEESAYKNCPMPINWNEIDVAERAGYIKGYIAGATENGIQWHDLRKDPNDLPQKVEDERQISDTVWIHIDNWGTEEGYYDYSLKSWIVRCRVVNIPVIAWCEIPQFKE